MALMETHWDIQIFTDRPNKLVVTCGCGWTQDILGKSGHSVGVARRAWDDHSCNGRPI